MILSALAALLAGAAPPPGTVTILREHVVVRVPLPRRPPPAPMTRWRDVKGPRCIDLDAIAGAAIAAPESVDIVLRGGKRLRAMLDNSCPALDFYSGFYLVAMDDGRICADRDAIRTRAGGSCQIARFRLLKPKPEATPDR